MRDLDVVAEIPKAFHHRRDGTRDNEEFDGRVRGRGEEKNGRGERRQLPIRVADIGVNVTEPECQSN